MQIKTWIKAARLRTLPLSVAGIIMGCGLAHFIIGDTKNNFSCFFPSGNINFQPDYSIFILALFTTIGLQILSNFANDYGDGIKGTDANREGEQRMVASGAILPKQMKTAIIITAIITFLFAILLIYVAFGIENFGYSVLFFFLFFASIAAAVKYTVGKNAYGYSGYGDVFVFLFFGWLSVVGSYFLYTKTISWEIFLPATAIGLLSVAVLNLNNMRDQIQDAKNNKITLVVKLGSQLAKKYHYLLIVIALVCSIIYVQLHYYSAKQYLYLLAFVPLVKNMFVVSKNILNKELDSELKKVALSTFLFAILFIIFN